MAFSMKSGDAQRDILIVEDSLTQAEKLKYILEENGYQVRHAVNGKMAMDMLSEFRPSIIISDILMPEMDGYDLCRHIRQSEHLNNIPVILLTSLSDVGDVIKGLESGANNFITKPYHEDHLLSRIQQLLANIVLREGSKKNEAGINVFYAEGYHLITAEPARVLDLLLSTYESAYLQNRELIRTRDELRALNEELDRKVAERTSHLDAEIVERTKAEAELKQRTEELRDMSQQLWQAAKLATMGELAASIAHELNNPLATVSLRTESLLAGAETESADRHELEIIEREVERMTHLVANLLQFSRRSRQQISTLNVCAETEKTLELIEYHLRQHNIVIAREYAEDMPHILADRQQLRQLFLNLFTNACDAMPRGGTLTIRVTALPESAKVVIEIMDTGTGIPAEILPKVTAPFYTTKPEGKGTGLGLAICRRIAQEHKGTFEVVSEGIPGRGTTARISLPVANGINTDSLSHE